jgi:hypothetical protein
MSDSQDDAQLSEKQDGLELRSENTRHMMVPQRYIVFLPAWKRK